ncbi:SpoIIE family protein phosphatase [Streptomyces sp. NBC_00059]|uniref:SpoIIE family protein phosphatase n=1 Tax=Streptomyces sp. NBC_00059 TaxID=2975635 RepID=UPI00338DAEFC
MLTLPDGRVMLTLGDIAGHDQQAATAMSQLHSMLRGIAYECPRGEGPAATPARLDHVARGLDLAPLVTVIHALLRRGPSGEDGCSVQRGSPAAASDPALVPGQVSATTGGARRTAVRVRRRVAHRA